MSENRLVAVHRPALIDRVLYRIRECLVILLLLALLLSAVVTVGTLGAIVSRLGGTTSVDPGPAVTDCPTPDNCVGD